MNPPFLIHRRCTARALAALCLVALAPGRATAHPAPFSYLDLRLQPASIEATLVIHVIDIAFEVDEPSPKRLLDPSIAEGHRDAIFKLIATRLRITNDNRPVRFEPGPIDVVADREAFRVSFVLPVASPPGRLGIAAHLFPYDPNHQTFLNIYEGPALTHQAIFDREHRSYEYVAAAAQSRLSVVQRFVVAGIHHIVIGPDHVLFLVGLLLLGGSIGRLAAIVTAFTLAHSLTLTLGVLGVLSPPARIVESTIALSIVYVGADNLLMKGDARDVRAWVALVFGLIHGFGFASVLQALDLPRRALAWSLFSFNLGVEIGQLALVAAVASLLAAIRTRNAALGRKVAVAGSVVVIAAGVYWFVERLLA